MTLGGKPLEAWVNQYEQSHQDPVNRACHLIGIPMIASSFPLFMSGVISRRMRRLAMSFFITGWIFQFVGHAFEGKPPEFFKDPRFLLVGLRWWLAKVNGRM
jgi:uncharacterized membrane protein YGL010W